jgi:hypothetical protein
MPKSRSHDLPNMFRVPVREGRLTSTAAGLLTRDEAGGSRRTSLSSLGCCGRISGDDGDPDLPSYFANFVGAFLFTGVDWLEPNRRFAIILKCAILAAGGIAIAEQLLP